MTGKRRIGGTCYFKVDGQQLSLNGSVEVPMNLTVREDVVGIDGSVHYKETHKAPYIKAEFKAIEKVPKKDRAALLNDLFGSESFGAIAPLLTNLS